MDNFVIESVADREDCLSFVFVKEEDVGDGSTSMGVGDFFGDN